MNLPIVDLILEIREHTLNVLRNFGIDEVFQGGIKWENLKEAKDGLYQIEASGIFHVCKHNGNYYEVDNDDDVKIWR